MVRLLQKWSGFFEASSDHSSSGLLESLAPFRPDPFAAGISSSRLQSSNSPPSTSTLSQVPRPLQRAPKSPVLWIAAVLCAPKSPVLCAPQEPCPLDRRSLDRRNRRRARLHVALQLHPRPPRSLQPAPRPAPHRRRRPAYWRAWTIALAALLCSFLGLLAFGVGFLLTSVWFWQVAGFAFATVFTETFRLRAARNP